MSPFERSRVPHRPIARAALAVLACCAAAGPLAADTDVEFVSPAARAIAIGLTPIEVRIDPPAGVAIEAVEFVVDGSTLGTLAAPPWRMPWDAGDGSRGHTVAVRVRLSDGTTVERAVSTSRLIIHETEEVNLVNLYFVAREGGKFASGLRAEDVRVLEDGRPQEISVFSEESKPLAIAIVLDTSTTMEGRKIEAARASALSFLDALTPSDRAMLVTFNDTVHTLEDLTTDRDALRHGIRNAEAAGGTALYDAIWKTSHRLNMVADARRVMVVLSDGRDAHSRGIGPGSLHTLEEALDRALRSEVMVFAIGFGSNLEYVEMFDRFSQADVLRRFGESTGGMTLFPKRAGALRKAFREVAANLRNQYTVAYKPDNSARDGAWREVVVEPRDPKIDIVTRKGYFAPSD